ncbi:NAD-dependent epimerase/dehydratase family protein [Ramlibacter tataouinensis]|uniref:UDP-galactose 4-epimerase n=1 Tax=Ramlibacter tataouinensis (strain ATCC BAA-407 / DSM 14655 / LMG 21543 / TTB310) TaxID=365046 RepID=F5Y0E6_RAMTT|nr:NAD(P)-dependent oxidoreductase [Ramlibacter tataouinensis]AEG92168.1 UDP- galactose 4-epimerase [Ramlibacter tataouinensis TTB310]
MKVLVLGGSGYIGSRLCQMLQATGWAIPISASSRAPLSVPGHLRLDTRDEPALTRALQEADAVVNCVAGSAAAIAEGAAVLARAVVAADFPRLVHFSSMAVYGDREGLLAEQAAAGAAQGWYARAKCDSERHIATVAAAGGSATVLRPGCVWGPGSHLWVGRIARWLAAGRLGDLGEDGDGWSNLVHVDDVCSAVVAALRKPVPAGQVRTLNLAGPDSPRWNDYFADVALAIGAEPMRRMRRQQMRADAYLAGPPLHVIRRVLGRLGRPVAALPDPLTPGLLGLWQRQQKLDATAAEQVLGLRWTPYATGLRQSMAWLLTDDSLPLRRRPVLLGGDRSGPRRHGRVGF